MGNICSREVKAPPLSEISIPIEEKAIQESEKDLLFTGCQAKDSLAYIKSCSTSGRLSVFQLKKVFRQLNLDHSLVTDEDSTSFKILRLFQTGSAQYQTRIVAFLALLLGQGTVTEKTEELFEFFDEDASQTFSREETFTMLEDMVELSAIKIPEAAVIDGKMLQEEKQRYTNKLLEAKDDFVQDFVLALMGNNQEISHKEFLGAFVSNPDFQRLLWTTGIRANLLRKSKLYGLFS